MHLVAIATVQVEVELIGLKVESWFGLISVIRCLYWFDGTNGVSVSVGGAQRAPMQTSPAPSEPLIAFIALISNVGSERRSQE